MKAVTSPCNQSRKRREKLGKYVQRKSKKKLTPATRFATVRPHTEHTNTKHMRTKTLLLTAALGAAGIASSMAQAVYSVNIVGYVNLDLKPGFNLISNPLNASPNNTLASVFGVVPDETQVLKFGGGNYQADIYFDGLGGWVDPNTGAASTTTIKPGEGLFYFNPAATARVATLVGEVQLGSSTVTHNPGFSLVASPVPQQITLTPAFSFNPTEEMQYLVFNATTQKYEDAILYFEALGGWVNGQTGAASIPTPNVGQGYFLFNAGAAPHVWTRIFTP